MKLFKKLYFKLFNSITDAIDAIDTYDYKKAKDILINAQFKAEERYIEWRATKVDGETVWKGPKDGGK